MISLLDVNLLIALFDPVHYGHEAAHAWFATSKQAGWATCPLTENGFVRVLSNPAYPGRRTTVGDAIRRLETLCRSGGHVFWTDAFSICDTSLFVQRHIRGHRQITDVYLLAVAVKNEGRLATLDESIPLAAVKSAKPGQLEVVSFD